MVLCEIEYTMLSWKDMHGFILPPFQYTEHTNRFTSEDQISIIGNQIRKYLTQVLLRRPTGSLFALQKVEEEKAVFLVEQQQQFLLLLIFLIIV